MLRAHSLCLHKQVPGMLTWLHSLPVAARPARRRQCTQAAASTLGKERQAGVSTAQESKGLVDTNPPRGTRDFAPEDFRQRAWLEEKFRRVSHLFGFEQFDTPVLESEGLFVRKAGEEITQQLYNFEDKGGRRVALRPELTPSLARLVIKKGKGLVLPAKWFTIGQCWRYERTTRGRRREHYQWNMDIVGVPGVAAEVELLSSIAHLLESVGLGPEDVVIKVSSRRALQAVLAQYEVPETSFGPACVIIDKLDKLPAATIEEELGKLGLAPDAIAGILQATKLTSLDDLAAVIGARGPAILELEGFLALAGAAGLAPYLEFDFSCVRGLAYYTGIVFEGRDRAGQLRAIFGGGRYDKLLETLGGEPQPCAGFGFGDCVIAELLQDRGLLPALEHQVEDLVVAMNEDLRLPATAIAQALRKSGRCTELLLESRKMKQVFKHAERCNAERLVLVAPDEWAEQRVRVKTLATREEVDIAVDELVVGGLPSF